MQLFDTHCHIHSVDYPLKITEVDAHSAEAGVTRMVCVGCDAADSERAVRFVADRPHSWASVGQHPHEAKYGLEPLLKLRALVEYYARRSSDASSVPSSPSPKTVEGQRGTERHQPSLGVASDRRALTDTSSTVSKPGGEGTVVPETRAGDDGVGEGKVGVEGEEASERAWNGVEASESQRKIVAIGECGLDYFYGHSSKEDQEMALRYQIELALEYDLPLIFHVREAFDDFWPIVDSYQGIRGVLHSYTDNLTNFSEAMARGLYIGVNGIMTFTKVPEQIEVAKQIPLNRLVLETDSPFLTPVPLRGKVNEPARVLLVAEFLSELRQISLQELAQHTTTNARQLFSL